MVKMIKIFNYILVAAILAFAINASAYTTSMIIAWEQEEPAEVVGWYLYIADAEVGPWARVTNPDGSDYSIIKSEPGPGGEYVAESPIVITGSAGQTVTKYFNLQAFNDTLESGPSNIVSQEFIIPLLAPHILSIEVQVVPTP